MFPVYAYVIIAVAICVLILLILCILLVAFLSKNQYRKWQIRNTFNVRNPVIKEVLYPLNLLYKYSNSILITLSM